MKRLVSYLSVIILLTGFFGINNAFAETLCLKTTAAQNKRTKKVNLKRSFKSVPSNEGCPRGFFSILDTASESTELETGDTVKGVIGGAGVVGLLQFVPISLSKAAPSAIQSEDMVIARVPNLSDITGNCSGAGCLSAFESAKDASVCTGTFDNPTAPVGKLCVYVDVNYGAYDLEVQLMSKSTNPNGGSRFGGGLQWRTTSGYVSKIKANWAYTAP